MRKGGLPWQKALDFLRKAIPIFHASLLELFAFDSQSPLGFLIHSIPSILILGALALSWKDPLRGGISFLLLGILGAVFFGAWENIAVFSLVSLPLFLSAGLCLVGRKLGKAP